MLSEVSRTEDKCHMISLICGINKQAHRYQEQTGDGQKQDCEGGGSG